MTLRNLVENVLGRRRLPIWYSAAYRLPLGSVERQLGIEPRRADLVAWFLVEQRFAAASDLRAPRRISYAEMARVHTPEYLESLSRAETLARIFAVDPSEVPVEEALATVRLAVGGTVDAAREALRQKGATLNLLGGFHHAAPSRGGGLCAVNDIAIAIASLRADGFDGKIAVLDLDAHPPDGTAECLRGDDKCWIGSLSGSWWGDHGADDVLVSQVGDARYLVELDALLARMGACALAFVVAGGDVLAGDRLGRVGLTLDGARRRDLRVAAALRGVGSVWLPGGGYSAEAWKVLAGTALALTRGSRREVPDRDPLASRYVEIAAGLSPAKLHDDELTLEDLVASLERRPPAQPRLLGYYSAEGIEYGLHRYGVLEFVERLGYRDFRVELEGAPAGGERVRLWGRAGGREHLLIDCVLEATAMAGGRFLYVHWLSLRNPRARFVAERPALPGQEVPGLGLSREMGELFIRMAARLGLDGVAFRPAWYHIAWAARHRMRFVDPERQGRFEALLRDLAKVPLDEATRAVSNGRVFLDGKPYTWEPDPMGELVAQRSDDAERIASARERARFSLRAAVASARG